MQADTFSVDIHSNSTAFVTTRRLALAALACLSVALWIIIHPYRGLEHDSVFYAILALSRLHPAALGHDLFVRYGSQDTYTVFSPVFAAAIRAVGLEPAAAIMTLATHILLFGAAYALCRRLMSGGLALLAVALLMVMPSWYGSGGVFAYIEGFLTPRQLAEALVLAGIAGASYTRPLLAGACMVLALLLHPTIAAAGITLWIVRSAGFARPAATATVSGIAGVCLLAASATGFGLFKHFDAAWLHILENRLAYLYPTEWTAAEWLAMGVRAAVLIVGVRFTRSEPVRRLCIATLATVILGMLFTIIESDWLHVIIAAQMQTWRWLWLAGVMSVLFAPSIALDCWRAGGIGRAAAVLLLSGWLTRSDNLALLPVLLACATTLLPAVVREPRQQRLVEIGAYLLLTASIIIAFGEVYNTLSQAKDLLATHHRLYAACIDEVQQLAEGGSVPAALCVFTWWLGQHVKRRGVMLLAALGATSLIAALPYAWQTWTHELYSQDRYEAFASWRAAIPEDAEILWPDPPAVAWFELGRASYWSLYQMAGMVFSRDVTMVASSREKAVTPLLPQLGRKVSNASHHVAIASRGNGHPSSPSPCTVPGVVFYASWVNLGPTPYPVVAPDAENPREALYLYRCDNHGH